MNVDYGEDVTYFVEVMKSSAVATADFTTTTMEEHPGQLDKWFLGASDKTTKTTASISAVHESDAFTRRAVHLMLANSPRQVLQAFYDMVFGSYVFQLLPDPHLQVDGTATDDAGQPIAGQWIHLNIGDLSVAARTDAQGHYAIYSSNTKPAAATLRIGGRGRRSQLFPGGRNPPDEWPLLLAQQPRTEQCHCLGSCAFGQRLGTTLDNCTKC